MNTVICDNCGKDITSTGNSIDYRIRLEAVTLPITPGLTMVTDMMVHPPVKSGDFCGTRCLIEHLNRSADEPH